ncbi:hypothetical protein PPYR_09360 [Photinus pyralis]|uniref:Uncharacterized protein n=1 Tax=Photinus pyralis TaxID=7054 RepID=A0A1Y1L377_PHOPY|nr:uncharacterized protein LOC116171838 [Photinus pyralis]KAB0798367.1 hypothetical protein PPYR_09360 [Photinus pyralis]
MVFSSVPFGYSLALIFFVGTHIKVSMENEFNSQQNVWSQFSNNTSWHYFDQASVAKHTFLELLSILERFGLPQDINDAKERLIDLVLADEIDVSIVMTYTQRFNEESAFDRMIAALLTLKDTIPSSCPLGFGIGNLILYAVFNKHRFDSHSSDICDKLSELPQYVATCDQSCDVHKRLEILQSDYCGRAQMVEVAKVENVAVNTASSTQVVDVLRSAVDATQLVSLLPVPESQQEISNLETLKSYMSSSEMKQYLQQISTSEHGSSTEVLRIVLKHIVETSVEISIKRIAYTYLTYMESTGESRKLFDYSILTKFLPQPINEEEDSYYATVLSFLQGTDIHYYLRNLGEIDSTNLALLYKQVLRTLAEDLELELNIRAAFKYYYDYEELFDDVELEAHRVLHKKFSLRKVLNGIFTELPLEYRDGLKLLLRFVSKYPATMNTFEIPTEVVTYGQLGRSVLDFLQASEQVPAVVKTAIITLIPHISYDGAGALLIQF